MKKFTIVATALALAASSMSLAPAANAAAVPAAKASVLKECSKLGEVAKKKGADGSDLFCIKATKGGMKGKQVWQYKKLPVIKNLDVIVPNSLTSGFGGFGKAIADALKAEGLTDAEPVLTSKPTPYSNSLKYVNEEMAGKAGKLAVTGFAQVGGAFTAKAGSLVSDGTPVARMYAEYSAIAVKADSKYKTIEELVADIKKDPKSMAIVGNAVGGVDYFVAAQLYEALGLTVKDMNYTANSTVAASILSDAKYAFAVSGYGDFPSYVQAGTLRLLAVTGPTPIKGVNVPTLVSKKIDVVVQNWRGIVLPPKTSPAGRALVIRALDIVNASQSFATYLETQKAFYNWLPGTAFDNWLKGEEKKIRRLYAEIGLL